MGGYVDLDKAIRKMPGFPKPGILFYDITSILTEPDVFEYCVEGLVEPFRRAHVDLVAAVESRGFLFGPSIGQRLGVGVVLVRKAGKLPGEVYSRTYDLEYGTDTVEMHKSDLTAGKRVLIVDDLVATGGTLRATADLITEAGCIPVGVSCVIGLPDLDYVARLAPLQVHTLIDFEGA
jgi:adenine phosphoribosyltransferase